MSNHCNGVDLNCGCPQRWAQQEGIGACLINKPDFIADLVKQTKNQCREDLSVSIKIRIHSDINRYAVSILSFSYYHFHKIYYQVIKYLTNLKHLVYFRTVDLCRQAEAAGISYLTVHGRRKDQKGEPVNLDAIKAIKDSMQIPVVANGDINSIDDAMRVKR